jgi:Ras-related protein Rab-1A
LVVYRISDGAPFDENDYETKVMGVDIKLKVLNLSPDPNRQQNKAHAQPDPRFWRKNEALVVVYDTSDIESCQNVPKWIREVELYQSVIDKETTGEDCSRVVVVGVTSDPKLPRNESGIIDAMKASAKVPKEKAFVDMEGDNKAKAMDVLRWLLRQILVEKADDLFTNGI